MAASQVVLAPPAIASDTFTRADSASVLGTTETGAKTWVAGNGTWGISGNKAYQSEAVPPGGSTWATFDIGQLNSTVEADVTLSGVSASTGVCVRGSSDSSQFGILVRLRKTAGADFVEAYDGSFIDQEPGGLVLGNTYRLRVTMLGASLTAYVDNVLVLTATTSLTDVWRTSVGLFQWVGGSDDDRGSRIDNFVVYG